MVHLPGGDVGSRFVLSLSVPAKRIEACCMKQYWHEGWKCLTVIGDVDQDLFPKERGST